MPSLPGLPPISRFVQRLLGSLLALSLALHPQSPSARPFQTSSQAAARVIEEVVASRRVTLRGNTHPLARPESDLGLVADDTPIRRILLLLERSPQQETDLTALMAEQQDPTSPNFHHWLTPQQLGALYGPPDHDLQAITSWLSGTGFTGISINSGRTAIEFSGTAAMIRTALHTSMHRYAVNGQQQLANASDPEIPAALAPVITGFASLNSFPRHALNRRAGSFRHDPLAHATTRLASPSGSPAPDPQFTIANSNGTFYGVTPYDFATIYNVLPLWSAASPIDGTGQTIAIVAETEINPVDFVNFRKLFHLPLGSAATPTGTQFLNIIHNGPSPGVLPDEEGEADIDTQWSAAVASGATIDLVISKSTAITQGTDLSAEYIVDNNLAPVMSYSYGACEAALGNSGNAFYNHLWQQAAAQGITVLVSAGDSGSAGCDLSTATGAQNGLAVNGLASTPYNTSVGGTDFDLLTNNPAAFWTSGSDPVTQASALGHIPETAWNETCTNPLFAQTTLFYNQTPVQICSNPVALHDGFLALGGGGGGPSTCTQSVRTGSSYRCTGGYPKPSWQSGTGVPADNVRDTPDVSLFASSGFLGVFYVVCQQSRNTDGEPCTLASPAYDFVGYGGTSVAAPAFAGILSLVNQRTGSRQGNANATLYALSRQQTASGTPCDAGDTISNPGCLFHDVTAGNNTQPCVNRTADCLSSGSLLRYGILSGYPTGAGYDLATGLGSVNVANLVNAWPVISSQTTHDSETTLALNSAQVPFGASFTISLAVGAVSSTPDLALATGTATITVDGGGVGTTIAVTDGTGTLQGSALNLAPGTHTLRASYSGDRNYSASTSAAITLSITTAAPSDFVLTPPVASLTLPHGASGTVTLLLTPRNGFTAPVTFTCLSGVPPGTACSFSPATLIPAGSPAAATLVITDLSAVSSASGRSYGAQPASLPLRSGLTTAALFLLCVPRSRRARNLLALFLSLGVLTALSGGCGGTSGTFVTQASSSVTAVPGIYTVTVAAAAGAITHTTVVNLTVQ